MATIGSLFSGVGGLELGLERGLKDSGYETNVLWQVERDAWCRRVLAERYPEAVRFDDVRTAANLPHVDLMCGGFPCQDVSVSGSGKGLSGERSGLWFQFLRIINEVRPSIVVVENSPMLRSRGLVEVLQGLAQSGYDAEWGMHSASGAGAPHIRERLVVVAYPQRSSEAGGTPSDPVCKRVFNPEDGSELVRDVVRLGSGEARGWEDLAGKSRGDGDEPSPSTRAVDAAANRSPSERGFWPDAPPPFRRVDDGVPTRLDRRRLKGLGNAVCVPVFEGVGVRCAEILQGRF